MVAEVWATVKRDSTGSGQKRRKWMDDFECRSRELSVPQLPALWLGEGSYMATIDPYRKLSHILIYFRNNQGSDLLLVPLQPIKVRLIPMHPPIHLQ